MWRVEFLPSARKELLSLRRPIQNRIREAIRSFSDDPLPADSIPMRGKGIGLHRLRIGSHRIVYRIQDEGICVLIVRIGHRADVYNGFED